MGESDIRKVPEWFASGKEYLDGYKVNSETVGSAGFSTSGGTERNTTGILFWKKVFLIPNPEIPGSKMCVVLMDTQGLWDAKTGNKLNSTIFGLSCMLSSYLIFNHKGTMYSRHLEQMATLSRFSEGLSMSGSSKPFQHFDLLNRDFTDISPNTRDNNKVFEKIRDWKHALETEESFKPSVDAVKDCFESFDVMCLPRPGDIDDDEYDGSICDIKDLFKRLMSYYIESIFTHIRPRRIGGAVVNGSRFIDYALRYGELFRNQTTFPDTSKVLDATYSVKNMDVLKEAIQVELLSVIDYSSTINLFLQISPNPKFILITSCKRSFKSVTELPC